MVAPGFFSRKLLISPLEIREYSFERLNGYPARTWYIRPYLDLRWTCSAANEFARIINLFRIFKMEQPQISEAQRIKCQSRSAQMHSRLVLIRANSWPQLIHAPRLPKGLGFLFGAFGSAVGTGSMWRVHRFRRILTLNESQKILETLRRSVNIAEIF